MTNTLPWLFMMSIFGSFGTYLEDAENSQKMPPKRRISDVEDLLLHHRMSYPRADLEAESKIRSLEGISNHRYHDVVTKRENTPIKSINSYIHDFDHTRQNYTYFDRTNHQGLEFYNRHHAIIDPPDDDKIENEYLNPAFELILAWKSVDFEFLNVESRNRAIVNGDYIPENNLPLGLEIFEDTVFLAIPRWKAGVPATLATVPISKIKNPKLTPYPNWYFYEFGNCDKLTSVFRMQIDECKRLWVLDSGKIDIANKPEQLCPPAIFIFDLLTHKLLKKYVLREEDVKEDSLFANIVVDVRYGECISAMAYVSDVFRYGLVVYDMFQDTSFRIQNHFFYPDPLASRYDLNGLTFYWTDGILGMALSPLDINEDRTLFFHPMSSYREFAVPTSILREPKSSLENPEKFIPIGKARAKDYGQSSSSTIDSNGIMFFNMVTRSSVWCWDTRKEYVPQNLGVIGSHNESLVFPNDIKVNREKDSSVWVLSNKLPMYLYGHWDTRQVNIRIFKAKIQDAVRGTVCDPTYSAPVQDDGEKF